MPFAEERRSYDATKKRTSSEYVKFSPDYKVVLRILNPTARTVWKHWIQEARGGMGLGAVCPNISAQMNICPIELSLIGLDREDAEDKKILENKRARRKFVVNVLDRTVYTTCPACGEKSPGKKCKSCGTDFKGVKGAPLNKVKILEQGPNLFNKQLNTVEKMQADDFDGAEITDYDINFITSGSDRDRIINAVPLAPAALPDDAMLDPETGEPQQLFDLDILAEPATVEDIEAYLNGAGVEEINALHGITKE